MVAWRFKVMAFVLAVFTVALIVRLANIQFLSHDRYAEQAKEEHWNRELVWGLRGGLRDRNGHPLAMTVATITVRVTRPEAATPKVAAKLAPILGMAPDAVLAQLARFKEQPVVLARDLPFETGQKVRDLDISGISVEQELRRVYPEGDIASTLIGFVGKDQAGLAGVESDWNREVAGLPGTLIYEQDSFRRQIPLGFREFTPPQAGAEVYLTIDRYIQHVIERELDNAIKQHNADGGTIIVMDPQTGEVLGMASRPSFDLTRLDISDPKAMALYRNRAITDLYEPGSIFKVVTMSAALESKRVTPESTFMDNGVVVKYGWPIYNWNGAPNGLSNMTDLLIHSSNVGAVWVSDRLGPDLFYKFVQRFGFGKPTGVNLTGEAAGSIRLPSSQGWSPIDLATNAFGQGLSITPLQMATAVSAIANGGLLMRPTIVKKVVSPTDSRVLDPVVVRRVISPETSQQVLKMMNAVVERGETKLAMVPNYHVGGKTGTASIPTAGGYQTASTIASFVGTGPLEKPRFVILVKIDEPKDTPWGSLVASPVFSAVAQQLLTYYQVPPAIDRVMAKG